jgi:tetratricopeptide (TPR) repeat protein
LCLLQFELGDYDEAATICEQVLEVQRRVLGDDHPSTLYSIGNLGTIYATQGKDEAAEPLLVESLKGRREALGVEHPFTLNALKDMAEFYSDHGRTDEARALRQEVLQIEARLKEAEAAE